MSLIRRATGPGRVNLIGDHTDYNGGLALPMAIDLGVAVEWQPAEPEPAGRTARGSTTTGATLTVSSTAFDGIAELPVDPGPAFDLSTVEPRWARLVAAMVMVVPPRRGGRLWIDTDLPVGAGLASSAAVAVALAEVFGVGGRLTASAIASLCQEAEHLCGVPVGAMDPLVCAGGQQGHALLIDFSTMSVQPIPLPPEVEIVVVDSGSSRTLGDAPYAVRVDECRAAAAVVGPLGHATLADLAAIADFTLRRRARHVVTECRRVADAVAAFEADDPVGAGVLMTESHRSLADDFEVSTPRMDSLVEHLLARPGVLGARLTGAGFGGCAVALCHQGSLDPGSLGLPAWCVSASDGTVARRAAHAAGPS